MGNKVVKYLFSIIFASISFYAFKNYWNFTHSVSNNSPIAYSFINKNINKGGRGETYDMHIVYDYRKYIISITSEEYAQIGNRKFPELYYSKSMNVVFSKWEIKMLFRVAILFFLLFIIAVVPWTFFKARLNDFVRKTNSKTYN